MVLFENFLNIKRQLLAASGVLVSSLSFGMAFGYSAVLLPQLESPNTEIPITPEEGSIIASMMALPLAIGCMTSSILMDIYGRRITLLLLNIPFFIGWIMMTLATDVWLLSMGRFMTGLGSGLSGASSVVYIAETSEPRFRGVILNLLSVSRSGGILASHSLGTFLHWRTASTVCASFSLLSYVLIYIAPESPTWLASRGFALEAKQAFHWLRGHSFDSEGELKSMLPDTQEVMIPDKDITNSKKKSQWRQNILAPEFVKPFLILLVFFLIQQFSGVNTVAFYSVTILQKVSPDIDGFWATIAIDIVRLTVSTATCALLGVCARRPLALVSALGSCVVLLGIAFILKFSPEGQLSLVALVMVALYITFVGIGILPIAYHMVGELFPIASREFGSAAILSLGSVFTFTVVMTAPILFNSVGIPETFSIYGGVAGVGFIFLYFFLPETHNKTLQEIETSFK